MVFGLSVWRRAKDLEKTGNVYRYIYIYIYHNLYRYIHRYISQCIQVYTQIYITMYTGTYTDIYHRQLGQTWTQEEEPKQRSVQERQCQTCTGVYSPHETQNITVRALKHSGGQNQVEPSNAMLTAPEMSTDKEGLAKVVPCTQSAATPDSTHYSDWATGWPTEISWFDSRERQLISDFSETSRPTSLQCSG
jgi:hypothetical protein